MCTNFFAPRIFWKIFTLITHAMLLVQFSTLVALAASNATVSGSEAVVRNLARELRSTGVGVELGQVNYDAKSDSARTLNVSVTFPSIVGDASPVALKLGSVTMLGATESLRDLSFRQLRIDDFQMSFAGYVLGIKTIILKDSVLSYFTDHSSSPGHPIETLVSSVGDSLKSEIGEFSFDKVSLTTSTPGMWAGLSIDRLLAHDLRNGSVGQIELSGLAVGGAGGQGKLAVGQVGFEQLSPAVLIGLINPESYRDLSAPRPWTSFVGKGAAKSVEISSVDGHTVIDTIDLAQLQMRRMPFDPLPLLDLAATNPPKLAEHSAEIKQFAEALFGVARLAQISVKGASSEGLDSGPKRRVSADSVDATGLEPRSIDSLTINNFQLAGSEGGFRAAQFYVKSVILPANVTASPHADTIPTFQVASLEGAVFVRPGLNVSVKTLRFETADHIGSVPTKLNVVLSGLVVPVAESGTSIVTGTLTDLGLAQLQINAALSARWQEADQQLLFEKAQIAVEDLGQISISGSLSGLSRTAFEHPETLGSSALAGNLAKANVGFADSGLVRRSFERMGALNKISVEDAKKSITINMPVILGQISDSVVRNRLIFACIEFLNSPKTIEIFTTMSAPLPISTIMSTWRDKPQMLPGLLKIDAVANRKS